MESDLISDAIMAKMFPDDGEEEPMQIVKVKKVNRHGIKQERICILSTANIYLLDKTDFRKYVPINLLKYIIKSTGKTEVIVYFTNESDILIEFKNDDEKDEFLNILKLRFASLCP